jgi:hypothetical protein
MDILHNIFGYFQIDNLLINNHIYKLKIEHTVSHKKSVTNTTDDNTLYLAE